MGVMIVEGKGQVWG